MLKHLIKVSQLPELVIFTGLFLSTISFAGGAQATTYSTVDRYGLNTNNQFAKFDSYPRMSQFQHSLNDPDQQFDENLGNRGGKLLRNRSTGKCINIHYGSGQEFNTFPCDPNDPDQNIRELDAGGGAVLLQAVSTGACIDLPERKNAGRVYTWSCDHNNPNQRFYRDGRTVVDPPKPTVSFVRAETSREGTRYASILASLRAGIKNGPGHSVFAVVKEWDDVYYGIYSNGERRRLGATSRYELTTVSTPGYRLGTAVNVDDGWDRDLVKINLEKRGRRKEGVSFRVLNISAETYTKFSPKSKGGYSSSYFSSGCIAYNVFGGGLGTCNCTTLSVTLFSRATGEKYDLGSSKEWIPNVLAMQIDKRNSVSDWWNPNARGDVD